MSKIIVNDINGKIQIEKDVNERFDRVAKELNDKVLYRDSPTGEPNQMKNDLDMNLNRIINIPAPVSGDDPVRLDDIENFGKPYIKRSGDEMEGPLFVTGAIINAFQVPNKLYVDNSPGTKGDKGEPGSRGFPGKDGKDGVSPESVDGKSAYQSWLDLGNTGTEQDFIDSLKGGSSTFSTFITPPALTYDGGTLKSIDYGNGVSKEFQYGVNGVLEFLLFTSEGVTTTKEFIYNAEGQLTSIEET